MRLEMVAELCPALTPEQRTAVLYDWRIIGRDDQQPPDGEWSIWLVKAGRGFGKSRTGAEATIDVAYRQPGIRIALVAPTASDVRDVMIEGESGIMACSPPNFTPLYEPSKRRLTWPNGSMATTFSAEEPARLRGPQFAFAWCDEAAVWKYAASWDNLMMGLRLGKHPQCVVTTTPKRTPTMKVIESMPGLVVTRGRTFDNSSNLAPTFLTTLMSRYEGTRLGRQELDGEDLVDDPDALWQRDTIDSRRVPEHPELARIVVAIDPAVTSGQDSDETGIIVAGIGTDKRGYVLADLSGRYTPDKWARVAIDAYREWQADRIVAESNQGGDMVSHTLRTVDQDVPVKLVHASRGKVARAEPVSALYQQGKVSHVGSHARLEDQLCTWTLGQASPDRLDALVWALTELILSRSEVAFG